MKIPFRSMICAPKGKYILSCDLSQAESWVVMALAREQNIKKALTYGVFHELSARIIFDLELPEISDVEGMRVGISKDQRYLGKKTNHGTSYRMGPFVLAVTINKESGKAPYVTVTVKQTKVFNKKWLSYFDLSVWWGEIEEAMNRDRTLITPYKRKRLFLAQWGDHLFKEATAFVPQSTVADHMFGVVQPEIGIEGGLIGIKKNIVDKHKDICIINTAHDSCLLEVPKESILDIAEQVKKELLRPIMINGENFTIPVDAEYSENWSEGVVKVC